ncbi:putative Myb/SANT-like domain-containing protein [Helianthus debilis subsp. tardiflorus]
MEKISTLLIHLPSLKPLTLALKNPIYQTLIYHLSSIQKICLKWSNTNLFSYTEVICSLRFLLIELFSICFNFQIMDLNHDNDVVVMKTKKKKIRSLWTDDTHIIFLELCLNEVRVGNKPTGYFNKFGYENLEKYMKERTGKTFDHKKIKNHWETMKKEWKLYDRLMRLESGIGWDPVRKTIDASDEWWDEKIKGDKDLSKLRGKNLEMYKMYYEPLFRDCVTVGDNTKTPSDFANMIDKDEELIEGGGDSDEINVSSDDQEPIFSENSLTKRKKSKNVSSSRSTRERLQ